MARSLDSLGWTKVGVCSCVVCMRGGVRARARCRLEPHTSHIPPLPPIYLAYTSFSCALLSYCLFLPPISRQVPPHLDLSSPSKRLVVVVTGMQECGSKGYCRWRITRSWRSRAQVKCNSHKSVNIFLLQQVCPHVVHCNKYYVYAKKLKTSTGPTRETNLESAWCYLPTNLLVLQGSCASARTWEGTEWWGKECR